MSDLPPLWSWSFVSFVLGCTVGWCANLYFYWRSRKDSARSSAQQIRYLSTTLAAFEDAGFVKLTRDGNGVISGGRIITIAPNAGALGLEGHPPTIEIRAQSSTIAGIGT
jgi:hypothetical protein